VLFFHNFKNQIFDDIKLPSTILDLLLYFHSSFHSTNCWLLLASPSLKNFFIERQLWPLLKCTHHVNIFQHTASFSTFKLKPILTFNKKILGTRRRKQEPKIDVPWKRR